MSCKTAFQLLCHCLAPDLSMERKTEIRSLVRSDCFAWEDFLTLARDGGVTQALADLLDEKGVAHDFPEDVMDFLRGAAQLNRIRNARIRAEALAAAEILNQVNIIPVFLKGGANLLSGLYVDQAQRLMVDLDILVPAKHVLDCAAALRRHGYKEIWDSGFPAHHHYPAMAHPDSIVTVELHVEPLDLPYRSLLPAEMVLADAVEHMVEGKNFATPSPTSRIIHAIAHTQLANHDHIYGRFSLRDMLDVALLYYKYKDDVDWRSVNDRFAQCRAGVALSFHVLAASRLMGIAINPPPPTYRLAELLYKRALWQVAHAPALRLSVQLIRPWLLLSRSLSSEALRKRLWQNLLSAEWHKRQWHMLRQKSDILR